MFKKILISFVALLAILLLSSCTNIGDGGSGIVLIDSKGEKVKFEGEPNNVVILQASLASVYLLSGGSYVGITSDYEDYGLEKGDASIVGTTKAPNSEVILSLNPDLIIYSDKIAQQVEVSEYLSISGAKTYGVHIDTFEDYLFVLKQFTKLTNRNDLYILNGANVKTRIDEIISRVPNDNPKVMFIRAFSSGFNILGTGNIVTSMLDDLKCDNIASKETNLSSDVNLEHVLRENPEYIFIVYMGQKNTDKTEEYLENNLYSNEFYLQLDAVKNNNVYILPTDLFHFKPNNRWADAYEYLFEILYKEN